MADDLTGRLDSLSPAKRQLLLERLRQKAAEKEPAAAPLTPVPRPPGGEMPLSFSQQQLWLIEQLAPGSPLYDIPAQMEAEGRLDAAALGAALAGVLQRHEALRTRFVRVEGEARQVAVPAPAFVLPLVDLSGLPEPCRRPEALAVADRQRRRGFDLESGLLLRAVLLRLEPERHALLLDIHHIASDGLSVGVLVRELAALYEAAASGRPAALPDLPIQYADFAWHQRQRLQGESLEEMLGYWRRRLADLPPPLPLPLDRPRPPVRSTEGRTVGLGSTDLPARFAADLARLGERQGATLFITLLAGLQALLSRITGQADVVVGTAVANRHRPEIEGLIGYFVNTLALRTRLDGDPPFLDLLARARETAVEAFAHQEVPFEKLVEDLKPERDLSLTPLFQVALALEPAPMGTLTLPGVTLRALGDAGEGTVKFDLTFSAAEADGHLSLSASYPPALFDASTVRRLLGGYARLLAGAAARPETPLSALPLLSEAESHQLTREWNDTAVAATGEEELPVHLQVAALARRTPGAPAVLDRRAGPSPLTYGELEARAGLLRRLLRDRGVGLEDRVALCLGRSAEAVVAMQAILGAGAAFVSLDPAHPAERLAFMLEDSGARVLLTRRPLLEAFSPPPAVEAICLDEIDFAVVEFGDTAGAVPVQPGNLCYVFYTSGSTGRPKGVAIEHRGLSNQVAWVRRTFGISPRDRATYLLGPSFDGTVFETWPSLTAGGCLEVIEDEVRLSPAALLDRLAASGITLSSMPTPLCEVLLAEIERRPGTVEGLALRVLGTGGDRLHRLPARPLPFRLFNLYGPTENSVTTTAAPVEDWSATAAPPIGRPLDNVRAYVLDAGLRLVPAGVAGELCAAGAGLARGYLGRPDQTAERFVPDPLSGGPGGRLYRTGDRVRLLADGQIEFLGRGDRQVKIRGFRVELGEVEGVLAEHPAVRACAVVVDPEAPGGPQIVAHVEAGAEPGELLAHLRRRLPVHMVPAAIVLHDALPLTANGKVDRTALLRLRPRQAAAAGAALRNAAEEAVAAVWQELLGVPAVEPDDSFFDLGGHSLLLVKVHERLVAQFPQLQILDLFRFPTVATLAAHLGPPEVSAPPARREDVPPPAVAARGDIATRGDIAVIGMAGRFPGAWSVDDLWRNLTGGVESIRLLGREELAQAGVAPEAADSPGYVPVSAALDGSDLFDAGFFGFTPREAEATDPQHRLFLECAWQALENAGYDPAAYPGRIGVFGGSSLGGYGLSLHSNPEAVRRLGGMQAKLGIDRDFLATRLSYKLGLTGPSFTVQTACSTSLVAVHLACRSLLAGECEMALAGGVSIYSAGGGGYLYEEGSILSPDGHCRAFDAAGRGTVPGEGVGLVVLKRLADALADGDAIDAVIRGSAINNDGSHKVGYTAPAIDGQAAVIRAALAAADVDPATVTYVEAHGTGTPLGDPIEVAALRQAFGEAGEGDPGCAIGSIKTNLGHLDCAAGVAGLIKTVLALRHGVIPPSLHFERPNPQIDFAGSRFYVNTSLADWRVEGPRRAGVSSFGIGGTNAHAVLEEAPRPAPSPVEEGWHLLVLSARSGPALEQAAVDLTAHLERHPDLDPADVAWTLQTGRRGFDHRRAVVCRGLEEARAALAAGASDRVLTGVRSADRPVAFLFPGQGSQRVDMARGLYAARPAFRAEVDRAAEILRPHLGIDLRDLLFPSPERRDEAAALLDQTRFTQPALFVVEHALARLWMSWGIEPWALLGHSIGEYVAACLAGVFTLEDALALVALRGRLVQDLPPGGMLGVPLPAGEVEALLGPLGPELSVAAVNAADRSVVAGPVAAVEDLRRRLAERGIEGRPLATSHAFHSAMMDPAVEALARAVAAVPLHPPRLPYLSNVTGTWITAEEATDPAYWGRHLRAPVRFAEGVRELLTRPGVLLEAGPGETLGRLARREARLRPAGDDAPVIVATLPSTAAETDLPEEAHLLRAAGRLWLAGARLDWRAVHGGQARRRVHLPTYPFERRRYWLEPGPAAAAPAPQEAQGKSADPASWFYLPSWKRSLPPPVPRDGAGLPDGDVVVFLDADGLGTALATRLRPIGRSVATVEAGDLFASLGDGAFVLRPGEPGDYDALLDALPGAGHEVSAIVHLWSFGGPAKDGFEAAVDRAFYSPLFLAQALARRRTSDRRLDLWLVSSHLHDVTGSDPVLPERSLLLGPARVIPLELPGVTCRSLDLDAGGRIDRAVDRVLAEMAAVSPDPAAPPILAWRGRQRWVQGFEPVRLEGSGDAAPRLRSGGVYLITGGLGGVGHAVALWLARTVAAKLVLVGRTPLPPRERWDEVLASRGDDEPLTRRLRRLRELEEAGAEVLVAQADVTDAAALARARDLARERWGEGVRGVIHAAGVPGGGVIPRKDRQTAGAVLAPKVQGTLALASVFPPEEMDLFVLFSSLNSMIGAYGQVDYCAANSFLDAFAASRAGSVVSIGWDLWEEAGMAVETSSPGLRRLTGLPSGVPVDHPLLDRRVPAGPGEDAYLTRFSASRHWVLDEHRIQGMPVLPGTAYLELVRAAFEQSTGSPLAEIRQATFLVPLAVPDGESRDVYTLLRRQEGGWSFRVASRLDLDGSPRWLEHAVGAVGEIGLPPAVGGAELPVLADLLAELPLAEAAPLPAGEGAAMRFGPRWSNLRRTAAGEGRALALLELPEELAADLSGMGLHPALLDLATGFAQGLMSGIEDTYVPFAYTGLRMERPLPGTFYSHARRKDDGPAGEQLRFEVTLLDPDGRLLVRIEDFAFRRVGPRSAATPPLETAGALPSPGPAVPAPSSGASVGLTSAEGVEAFRRILAGVLDGVDLPQVMVSVLDLPSRAAAAAALTGERLLAELGRDGGAAPAGPRHGRPDLATPYVEPRTEAERRLAEVWGDLLGIEAVGIHDDFFELGGDSVLGLRIVARAREHGLVLTPGQLFERPTIAGLAAGLETTAVAEPAATEAPPPPPEGGAYDPASFPDADVSQRDLEALLAQLGGTTL